MNEVTTTLTKITVGLKSPKEAVKALRTFFNQHDYKENSMLIKGMQDFISENKVGRRSKEKIVAILSEIIGYLHEDDSGYDTTSEEYEKNMEQVASEYDRIVRESILAIRNDGMDMPLSLLPVFWEFPTALIVLNYSGITMLQDLTSCSQERLLELLKDHGEVLTQMVLLLKPIGIEIKVPTE